MDTLLLISYILNITICLVSGAFILLIKVPSFMKDRLYRLARYYLRTESPPLIKRTFTPISEIIKKWQEQPDKPYLTPSITIEEVASRMKCDKRDLSKYINTVLSSNFNSWINQLRIEEVERLINSRKELSLTEISDKTGFADLPMMSRYFKKFKGVSPSEYKKQYLNNK